MSAEPLTCPMCTLPMTERTEQGLVIDRCANEHVFFDRHELGAIDERGAAFEEALHEAAAAHEQEERRRPCARCGTTMVHLEHDGQKAEVCQSCGGVLLWSVLPTSRPLDAPDREVDNGVTAMGVGLVALESTDVAVDVVEAGGEVGFALFAGIFEVLGALLSAVAE